VSQTFDLLHDNGKPLCFVSTGSLSSSIHADLSCSRPSKLARFEEVKEFDHFDRYQYICLTSDIVLKKQVVNFLEDRGCSFFSVIHKVNHLHNKIGHGTFVNGYNQGMSGDRSRIGNHCVIATHSLLSHDCIIDDFCHVSSFAFLARCHLEQGCCLGIRVSVFSDLDSDKIAKIPEFTNLISGSMITTPILQAGTYFSNRRISHETSLTKRIL
jgi:hypothetical protein